MYDLYKEKELLKLIAAGDENAFTKLFHFYRNRIYSIALKLTHSTICSEEIVQDVFLKIWQKRASLTEIQNFSSYLFIVARNECYGALKQIAKDYNRTILAEEYLVVAENKTADCLMEKEYDFLLQKAVECLPGQQKQVYKLIKGEGLKREEVAHLLQLQPETVKFHLAKAMKTLRAFCQLHLDLVIGLIVCLPALFKK